MAVRIARKTKLISFSFKPPIRSSVLNLYLITTTPVAIYINHFIEINLIVPKSENNKHTGCKKNYLTNNKYIL